jgi:hypothetical protein
MNTLEYLSPGIITHLQNPVTVAGILTVMIILLLFVIGCKTTKTSFYTFLISYIVIWLHNKVLLDDYNTQKYNEGIDNVVDIIPN